MLMYEHTFIFANKHLTPTEIAMQLESGVKTAIYFCEMTFFLLVDALGLKGTIVTPQRSTSSFRFEDQDTSKCTLSNIVCVVAANQVFALERQHQVHMKKSCPLMDFWRDGEMKINQQQMMITCTLIGTKLWESTAKVQ